MNHNDKLEALCMDVWKDKIHFKVIGLYNPPNNIPKLEQIACLGQHRNTIIVGDFNAHSSRWGYSNTSATGKAVEELLDNSSLIRIPSGPTFLSYAGYSSSPDLAFTHANLTNRSTLSLEDPLDGCGHRLMYLQVQYKCPQPRPRKITRWNFKKARWQKYSRLSNEYVTEDLVNDNPDVSTAIFAREILRAAAESIPRGQVKKYLPFWNESLETLKSERNAARCRAESSRDFKDCILLRKSQAKLKRAIILFKRAAFRSFAASLDFRRDGPKAHKFISSLNNEKTSRQWKPISTNGKVLTSPIEVAVALSKNYAAVSRLHITAKDRKSILKSIPTPVPNEHDALLLNSDFSHDELLLAITSLKKGKSAGPDGIFPELIINLGSQALNTFLKLINLTWKTTVPNQWTKAEVISLLKKGKPADSLNSYRPISLTSVCCKVAEKMIDCRLRKFLESKGAISDCQAGFRKHRSTIDQVVKLTQAVKDGFQRKQSTLAVLVDLKAAYDKVWRGMLIHKLKKLGVTGNMLNWVKSFLSQRHFRCKFLTATSPWRQLRQGLPQGAVLSCLLFNIMIDDLTLAIHRVPGVSCLFFADDVVIWATGSNIKSLEDAMNESLLNLATWADMNKLEVSTEKTVSQLFTMSTKQQTFNLVYKGLSLKQVSISKYLGVNLDSKLCWNSHITDTSEKSHKRLNLLKRLTATKWGATQDVLTTVYKTYVRPVLDYGCEVVTLASTTNLKKYDVVQNTALRIITGGAKSTPITAMQLQTGIEPLNIRRDKFTLKFWERARRVDWKHWNGFKCASQRLKTQTSPLTHAENLMQKYKLPLPASLQAALQCFTTVAPALPTYRLDLINLSSNKTEAIPEELKACALDTIEKRYPPNEWLHIYTDGSYLPESNGAGAGWYCRFFEDSLAVGKYATNYDGEVAAVYEATNQLLAFGLAPEKVAFLVDSQAAILALSNNNPTDCLRTIQCRLKLAELILLGWNVTLQWIPSHVGIPGNEKADKKAKLGAESAHTEVPLTLSRAKTIINTFINKSSSAALREESIGKRWETLAYAPIPSHLERAEAVARFRLTTGHDFLGVHLHRLGLAADEACPLCGHARMDADHLKQCSALALHPADDVVSRYWEARRQMAERPRTGVG